MAINSDDLHRAIKFIEPLEPPYQEQDPVGEYNIVLQRLIEDCSLDADEHKASSVALYNNVIGAVKKAAESEHPEEAFRETISESKRKLAERRRRDSVILFPLNTEFHPDFPNEVKSVGLTIERVDKSEWESFADLFSGSLSLQRSLQEFDGSLPEEIFSFWKIEEEIQDPMYFNNLALESIRTFLAKANLSIFRDTYRGSSIRHTGLKSGGTSNIGSPFVLLQWTEDFPEYTGPFFTDKGIPVNRVDISNEEFDDEIWGNFPSVSPPFTEIEERFLNGVTGYHEGITTSNSRNRFLQYWQGLEQVTLVQENQSSLEVLKRVNDVLEKRFDEYILKCVADSRNKLVHEGTGMISSEANVLKTLLEDALLHYSRTWREFSIDERRYIFRDLQDDSASLDYKRDLLETRANIIDRFRDSSNAE